MCRTKFLRTNGWKLSYPGRCQMSEDKRWIPIRCDVWKWRWKQTGIHESLWDWPWNFSKNSRKKYKKTVGRNCLFDRCRTRRSGTYYSQRKRDIKKSRLRDLWQAYSTGTIRWDKSWLWVYLCWKRKSSSYNETRTDQWIVSRESIAIWYCSSFKRWRSICLWTRWGRSDLFSESGNSLRSHSWNQFLYRSRRTCWNPSHTQRNLQRISRCDSTWS